MEEQGTPIGRRLVLAMMALGGLGIVAGSRLQRGLESALAPIQSRDPTGLTGLVPGGGGFRFYSVTSSVPTLTTDDYRLEITGLVDKPVTLTYADLLAMPQTSITRDFQCVTGWRVGDVPWVGVKLSDILSSVGVQTNAKAVAFGCFDGAYTESLTLEQAMRDDVIVAHQMLDAPVTKNHGGPVRLYVAPMYGYKSAKWLDSIELTSTVVPGYWEQRGYDIDGWVGESNGRDDKATV